MLERTKKPPTEIEISFKGPKDKRQEAVAALERMGFVVQDTPPDWRTAFSVLQEDEPGTYLAGARHKESLTQRQLAELCGIPQRHISEMENGKRPIGKENAKKLGKALHTDYRVFL